MELSDRETLIKLEQQFQNYIENQRNIKEAQKVIFEKIDKNSKVTFDLKSKLQTILETSELRKEQIDNKINENSQELGDLKEEAEERKGFESEIKGSLRTFKWLLGLGMLVVAILQLVAFIYFSGKGS